LVFQNTRVSDSINIYLIIFDFANPLRNKNREDKRKLRSVFQKKKNGKLRSEYKMKKSKELKQINKHK